MNKSLLQTISFNARRTCGHALLPGPRFLAAVALLLCAVLELPAQPGPGGFGGFGGFGGAASRSRSSTSRQYPNNGTVGDAVISVDPETHSLVVIADDDTTRYISQVVSNLDRPKPQVLIKVVFVEITHNNSSDIGIEGAWGKNIGNSMTGAVANAFGFSSVSTAAGSNSPLANIYGQPITAFAPIPPGAGLYQIFSQDYQVTLRAIATSGKAKILSRPSIVARNNQPATILVGQTVPLITSVRYDTFGNAINGITYTDVGIILRVTPYITPDGLVEMILSPEISSVSSTERVQIQNATFAPVIDKRSADTVVVTPDGQTVIIGGLIQNQKAAGESKIPVLGDIPILGSLFKRKTRSDAKTELLIFLTPHIVPVPTEMVSLTETEHQKTSLPRALTDDELQRFLDKLPTKDPAADPSTSSGGKGKAKETW